MRHLSRGAAVSPLPQIAECAIQRGLDGLLHITHVDGATATAQTGEEAIVAGMRLRLLAFYATRAGSYLHYQVAKDFVVVEHGGAYAATWLGALTGEQANQLRQASEDLAVNVMFSDRLMRGSDGGLLWTFTLACDTLAEVREVCTVWEQLAAAVQARQ